MMQKGEPMRDMIYRQEAIDELNRADDIGTIRSILDVLDVLRTLPSAQPEDYAHGFADGYKQGKKDAQPTADVRENVRGEWIPINGAHQWKCSNCGEYIGGDADCTPYINKFCWNCGADMR